MIGYIFANYVTELPAVQIERIDLKLDNQTLQKGERKRLQVTIFPQEASDHKIYFSSSNPNVATVDDNGNIQAIRSGTTTITVKAQENSVQNQMEIKVYTPVTGISMDQTKIYIPVGDTFKIHAYIEPDDADNQQIRYESSNPQIATIEESGVITAHLEGEANILAISEENSNIKSECKVIVVRNMQDSEIHFDSSLTLNSLEISGMDYQENTVGDILSKITTDLEIEIVNNKDEVLQDTNLVGTGSKIRVKENGKILREYTILLYGDINGDGKIDSVDLLVLQRHILEIETVEGIYKKAGNIRKNGKKPTSLDLLLIQRHVLRFQIIEQ